MKKFLLTSGTIFFLILSLVVLQIPQNIHADEVPDPYTVSMGVSYAQVLDYYKLAVRTKVDASVYAVKHEVDCQSQKEKSNGKGSGVAFASGDVEVAPLIACTDKDLEEYDVDPKKDWERVCKAFSEKISSGEWKQSFTGILTKETCELYSSIQLATKNVLAKQDGLEQGVADPDSPVLILKKALAQETDKLSTYLTAYASDIQSQCQSKANTLSHVIDDGMIQYAPLTYRELLGAVNQCKDQVAYDFKNLKIVSDNIGIMFFEFFHTYPQHVLLKKMEKEVKSYVRSLKDALSALDTIDTHVPGQIDLQNK